MVDDSQCVDARGSGGEAACIRATSTLTPNNSGPPNPLTVCGGGEAAAADD